ncbi:hypothetical protein [Mycolicibacterium sphagni]|uniref:Uncharacterized protein n=1 Tax=Mycolicibacterium sphagni TaxID=1786 RepID=A0ABX2JTE4_9MYCO|nr:hypothetical protein [Mycolicibacterium sphagni]NTY60700.1 hypothetical protein [Mycolicibacterium sphagni]
MTAQRRWRLDSVRHVLIVAMIAIAIEGVAAVMHIREIHQEPPPAAAALDPPSSARSSSPCEGISHLYAIHGTDCRDLPVVTTPGALGPANTGGPAGGTDWEPAYPGSNIWIPDYQISGRLFVIPAGSHQPPPVGYERLGQTPSGATLYWRPIGHADDPPAVGNK